MLNMIPIEIIEKDMNLRNMFIQGKILEEVK